MADKIEQKIKLIDALKEEITKQELDKDLIISLIKELINLKVLTNDIYEALKEEEKKELSSILIENVEFSKDASLLNFVGNLYFYECGVVQDYKKTVEYLEKAVAKGYEIAAFNLGVMYYKGNRVVQDYKKAIEYFEKAAARGYARAECNLGEMYENGKGVNQDYNKAFEYYEKAAAKGDIIAECNLGAMYIEGLGVNKDYNKALEIFNKLAEKGCGAALNNLGSIYLEGLGVLPDYKKAVEYYKKAAEKGHEYAEYNIIKLQYEQKYYAEVLESIYHVIISIMLKVKFLKA
ncbi:MAG: tetratricopeptide repeat protein [Alphaproteobacteria bacterium]